MRHAVIFFEPLYGWLMTPERAYEIAKFGIAGTTALTVNLVVIYVLENHMWYLYASMVAFVCSLFTSFSLQKLWTFQNRTTETVHIQAGMSIAIALANLGINTALMYLAVSILGFYYLYAQVFVTLCIAAESYLMYKYVIFRMPKENGPERWGQS